MRTTGPGESALLLLDAVDVLTAEAIDYAVVGAMAGSVHGIVRASFDANAVLSLAVQRAPELERKFKAAGFETTLRRGDPDDPIGALLSLADAFENRVDLLIGLRALCPDLTFCFRAHFTGCAYQLVAFDAVGCRMALPLW